MQVAWQVKRFNELNLDTLYDILTLRVDVFVVEQRCYYPELDGLDRHKNTLHLFSYHEGRISAYLRILPMGTAYSNEIAIGRVVVNSAVRGSSLGHDLLEQGLAVCQTYFPGKTIKISAQQHLANFYQKHGFKQTSAPYLEDGIAHIAMQLTIS